MGCSYSTYALHFKEVQCFQGQVEQLLYDGGADIVFAGHVRRPLWRSRLSHA